MMKAVMSTEAPGQKILSSTSTRISSRWRWWLPKTYMSALMVCAGILFLYSCLGPMLFTPALTVALILDIGGLDTIIEELRESVIYPLTMPHLYSHAAPLLSAPSGVILFGPPGCGKTMLAKALAHESGASFINLHISTMTEKWYGDSNKIVRAVFSLARKMQPAIIFIDEIDAVLGTRRSGEHEASGMVKAE